MNEENSEFFPEYTKKAFFFFVLKLHKRLFLAKFDFHVWLLPFFSL